MHMNRSLTCLFVPYWPENPYQDELAKSLESHGIHVDKGGSLRRPVCHILLRRDGPDIIHLHWLPPFQWELTRLLNLLGFILALCILRMCGVRLILTVHNLRPHESRSPRGDWLTSSIVIAMVNAIIVHSAVARRQVLSTFHLAAREHKVFVVPHGNYIHVYSNSIDRATARATLGIVGSQTTILFLGHIRPYKGVFELIGAFRQLIASGESAGLVIAGKPLDEEFSHAIAVEVEQCQAIRYMPRLVPDDELAMYLNACDVTVYPYRQILSSGAVILAMSFARACIAPRLGCIQDVLDDTGAFLYDPQDEHGLLKALKAACARKADLLQMGEYNRRKAERWNWNDIGNETRRVYLSRD